MGRVAIRGKDQPVTTHPFILVRHGDHQPLSRHASQFPNRGNVVLDMLEDIEADGRIERPVTEGKRRGEIATDKIPLKADLAGFGKKKVVLFQTRCLEAAPTQVIHEAADATPRVEHGPALDMIVEQLATLVGQRTSAPAELPGILE